MHEPVSHRAAHGGADQGPTLQRSLTILHLTDLHFASRSEQFPSAHYWNTPEWLDFDEPEYNRRGLLDSVLRDLEKNHWKPDLVIVSGDLLDRGQESGVPLAIDFLQRLSVGLSLHRDRFVLVPGNHDEVQSAQTAEGRYVHFARIWDGFFGSLRPWAPGRPANAQVELFDLREQLGVQIIGFNSCEGHDRGLFAGGAVGRDQRDRAEEFLKQSGMAPFRIAVMHHHLYNPVGARKQLSVMEGATEIRRWLKKHRFHLALHGHQHVDWHEEDSAGDWILSVVAGASAGVGKYGRDQGDLRIGYQVIQVEDERRGLRFRRRYDPLERSFMQAGLTREESLKFGACPSPLSPPPNYEILELLGEGPMGLTYKVRYLPLNQVRAMKVLVGQRAIDAMTRFLKNESEVLSRLEHIGFVKVHEININAEHPGYRYTILEYAEGRNLRAILDADKHLSLKRALHVVTQIVQAIQYAHEHGIIHCDLKPANIIVDTDNAWRVRVVDFGLAHFLQPGQRQAPMQHPGVIGTLGYKAPELDSEETATVQSDLYSIGIIFHEMLVGRRPGEGGALPLRQARSDVPPAVWEIVDNLLERAPKNRPASASNVLKALKSVSRSPSRSDISVLEMNLNLIVQQQHLPDHFRRLSTPAVEYARFFEFVAHEPLEVAAKARATLLERTAAALEEFNQRGPLGIDGASGTGKTAFLAALYWYLRERREKDVNAPIPLYINLASYDARRYNGSPETHFEKALAALRSDLSPYITLRDRYPQQRFIAIIDHFDVYGRFRRRLGREVLAHCQSGDRLSLLIGRHMEREVDANVRCAGLLSFQGVSTQLGEFEEFVRLYAEAHGLMSQDVVQHMTQQIKSFKLEEIDCRMLWLLLSLGRHSRQPLSLSELHEWECTSFLARHEVSGWGFMGLQRPAELAFRYEVIRDDIDDSDLVSWKLLRESSYATRCFLAAVHIVGTLLQAARGGELPEGANQILSYFYPWMITRFCRELIAAKDKNQHLLVDAAETIFDRAPVSKHAIMYFLLGRVENRNVKRKASALLKKQKQVLAASKLDPKIAKVLDRTIEISMIVLNPYGEQGPQTSTAEDSRWQASQRYIRTLIQDPEADALNRGFLIEYYGDVPFTPTREPAYEDELSPCPRTFENHYKLIEGALHRGANHFPLFELELYSLCSLASHRHLAGKLADSDRERILGLVKRILQNSHALNLEFLCPELMLYLQMIERAFARKVFSAGAVVEELYALKVELRQGWVRHNLVGRGESVAEHMYGAFLLAWLYLPESTEYSKDKILRMLLLHDVNEALTGDKHPGEKTDNDWAEARQSIDYLSMLGTHKDLPGLTSLKEAWSGFADKEGVEGRIANDFDTLELLVQLLIYLKKRQLPPVDEAQWRKRITSEITTPQGRRVLEIIIRHFEGHEAPLDP